MSSPVEFIFSFSFEYVCNFTLFTIFYQRLDKDSADINKGSMERPSDDWAIVPASTPARVMIVGPRSTFVDSSENVPPAFSPIEQNVSENLALVSH